MTDYDPKSEATLSGTVEEVITMDCGCMGRNGTHVRLRAEGETRDVARRSLVHAA